MPQNRSRGARVAMRTLRTYPKRRHGNSAQDPGALEGIVMKSHYQGTTARTMLVLLIVTVALSRPGQVSGSNEPTDSDHGIYIDDQVVKHVDLVYTCWNGAWGDTKWQRAVTAKVTRWCGNLNEMTGLIDKNDVGGARTLVLQRLHENPGESCTRRPGVHYPAWKTLKWIEICGSHRVFATPMPGTTSLLPNSPDLHDGGNTSIGMGKAFWLSETAYDIPASWSRRISALSGKQVTVACVRRDFLYNKDFLDVTTCKYEFPLVLMKALAKVNASLRAIDFPLGSGSKQFLKKNVNVLMFYNRAKAPHARVMEFAFVEFVATTFYIQKPPMKTISPTEIVKNSRLTLSLLVGSLLVSFLALKLMDSLKRGSACLRAGAGDTVMFFISTFYGTSSDLPLNVRWPNSRQVLISTWLLSTLSLSVYIKGELTSWLNISVPVRVIEDPAQLDEALQGDSFSLCIDEGINQRSLGDVPSKNTILGRLTTSVQLSKSMDIFNCFVCAKEENHACVATRQDSCFLRMYHGEYIESKEGLWGMPYAILAYRDFQLWKALRTLSLRVTETGWRFEDREKCRFRASLLPVKETKKPPDFTAVGYTILVCYAASFVAFCLELLLQRGYCP